MGPEEAQTCDTCECDLSARGLAHVGPWRTPRARDAMRFQCLACALFSNVCAVAGGGIGPTLRLSTATRRFFTFFSLRRARAGRGRENGHVGCFVSHRNGPHTPHNSVLTAETAHAASL